MTIIYCAQDKRSQAIAELNLGDDRYDFRSPNDSGLAHHATRVIVVGSHPSIGQRYKGIAKVETLTLNEDE